MDKTIPFPRSKYGYASYKRVPLVVKAFQWPGWSAEYDPLNKIKKLPLLTALHLGLSLGTRLTSKGIPPQNMGLVGTLLIAPNEWLIEHEDGTCEVLTDQQWQDQYEKCDFVTPDVQEHLTSAIPHPQESEQKEAVMSYEEAMQKASQYVCTTCNNTVDPATQDWRFEDGKWLHYHGYMTGWIKAVKRL